jgi:hypothetical protein
MERINFKRLKDALNKLPDDCLENFFVIHKMCIEDPEVELGLVFFAGEEDWEKHLNMLEIPEADVLIEFVKMIGIDAMKVAICKLDEDKMDDYLDDGE